ncbi:Low temperature viability protein [Elsinoe ampelina]|uniref:Low temperature viability protein n=1 Tax=Elsinoe ampelina TaxID=302913 RepID=A0A6A6G221_9PEZI|nr:Low temperature viability protein [Elsinoe ampelina]
MPRRQFIDRKTATTFSLVHRAQNDPLIHSDAPQMVLAERGTTSASSPYTAHSSSSRQSKTRQRGDLEDEFGFAFAKNEGQAAEQGVFYDDTQYDYMQHMRDLGAGAGGDVTWVEAKQDKGKGKGKGKQTLEDALRDLDVDDANEGGVSLRSESSRAEELGLGDMTGSDFVRKVGYQDMQDVPDQIAGFQPDMDPRLREVLEALEDEAYVDDDEDVFGELTEGAEVVDEDDFESLHWQEDQNQGGVEAFVAGLQAADDDEGWESDDTIKAGDRSPKPILDEQAPILPPADPNATPAADPTDGNWLSEYSKFKSTLKAAKDAPSESQADRSMLSSLATGRKKKRKGAKTSTTNYSMTSSALARTDTQTLLDDRFDKLMEKYDADDYEDGLSSIAEDTASMTSGMTGLSRASRASRASNISKASGMSGMSNASRISTYSRATDSEAPQLVRTDFDSIMDGFLEGQTSRGGKSRRDIGIAPGRKGKRGVHGEGLRELDEIRSGLGPARLGQMT